MSDISFLKTAKEYRTALFDLVDSAQDELHVEFYIFNHDSFGKIFLRKLVNAAQRGVNVRLILDGFGSEKLIQERFTELRKLPLDIRIYHPLPWGETPVGNPWKTLRDFLNYLGTLNRRNHRKLVMADQHRMMIGSHNIWNESLEWQEASLLVNNKNVARTVLAGFSRIWHKSVDLYGKKHRRQLQNPLESLRDASRMSDKLRILDNSSLGRSRASKQELLRGITNSKERIWIVTPYFCPTRTVMRALKKLARAGVDVRLLLPGRLDINMARWLSQALYQELLECGIRIYEFFDNAILHAKVTVMDNRYIVGSSNLNHRSVLQDLEIDCLGSDTPTLNAIDEWLQFLITNSTEITDIAQVEFYEIKRLAAQLLAPLKNFR